MIVGSLHELRKADVRRVEHLQIVVGRGMIGGEGGGEIGGVGGGVGEGGGPPLIILKWLAVVEIREILRHGERERERMGEEGVEEVSRLVEKGEEYEL